MPKWVSEAKVWPSSLGSSTTWTKPCLGSEGIWGTGTIRGGTKSLGRQHLELAWTVLECSSWVVRQQSKLGDVHPLHVGWKGETMQPAPPDGLHPSTAPLVQTCEFRPVADE